MIISYNISNVVSNAFCLACFGFGFGLVRFGLVWFGLVWLWFWVCYVLGFAFFGGPGACDLGFVSVFVFSFCFVLILILIIFWF